MGMNNYVSFFSQRCCGSKQLQGTMIKIILLAIFRNMFSSMFFFWNLWFIGGIHACSLYSVRPLVPQKVVFFFVFIDDNLHLGLELSRSICIHEKIIPWLLQKFWGRCCNAVLQSILMWKSRSLGLGFGSFCECFPPENIYLDLPAFWQFFLVKRYTF